MWILAETDGTVATAHCTCMAGVGEACSHVATALFAVETAVRLRDSVTCTGKKNEWLPPHSRNAEFKRLREIDFSSAKMKKRKMDTITNNINAEEVLSVQRIPSPKNAEIQLCFAAIAKGGTKPALFMLHEEYSALLSPTTKERACGPL